MNIIINGAGKMGKMVRDCTPHFPEIKLLAVTGRSGVDVGGQRPDVVIDFSSHTAVNELLSVCVGHRIPLVIGTTGHSEEEVRAIREGARAIPLVYASNFSTGMNVLFSLVAETAKLLGPTFDVEVTEMHHHHKKDAPSGSAWTLAAAVAKARDLNLNEAVRHGRFGIVGARTSGEIGIHSLRGGDVVGEHTVIFAGEGERIELTHKASSREAFARGAIRAAQWIVRKPPGLYSMKDVLGLNSPVDRGGLED